MNEQQKQATPSCESYSAPDYDRFIFETSGLVQASDPLPAYLGAGFSDASTASEDSDW